METINDRLKAALAVDAGSPADWPSAWAFRITCVDGEMAVTPIRREEAVWPPVEPLSWGPV